jgi:hypothetical protein
MVGFRRSGPLLPIAEVERLITKWIMPVAEVEPGFLERRARSYYGGGRRDA